METPRESDNFQKSFESYVEELQELFTISGVRYGSPAAFFPFMERLEDSNSLRNDLSSLMRSILYRERESISRGQLAAILVAAVSGCSQERLPPEANEYVQQLNVFVSGVLRSRQIMIPLEVTTSEEVPEVAEPVSQGARKLNTRKLDRGAEQVVSYSGSGTRNRPAAFVVDKTPDEKRPETRSTFSRPAMHRFEDETPHRSTSEWNLSRFKWTGTIALAMVLLVGMAVYITRMAHRHAEDLHVPENIPVSRSDEATSPYPVNCVGVIRSPASASVLHERYDIARELMEQSRFDAALPLLREIAVADPGFPGINLAISQSFLHLNRANDAKRAVSLQSDTTDCLVKIPAEELKPYCAVEFPAADNGSCLAQLTNLRQMAHFQTMLVDMELARRIEMPDSDAQSSQGRVKKPGSRTQTADRSKEAGLPTRREHVRTPIDPTQIEGTGTDSNLGAYSKPPL